MLLMMTAKTVITLIQGVAGALVKAVEMESKVKGEEVEFAINVLLREIMMITYIDHIHLSGVNGGGNESSNGEDFEETRMGGSKKMMIDANPKSDV